MTKSYDTMSIQTIKSNKRLIIFVGVLCLVAAVAVAIAVPLTINSRSTSLEKAKKILDEVPIIDGHNDWAWQFRKNLKNSIDGISLHDDLTKLYNDSHTDIPRLREGKVGAQFWACFVLCASQYKDAVRQGLEQIDMIRRFTDDYPDTFAFATTVDEIKAANAEGKIASMIGVEGGHMIDSSLAALRMLFKLGARYMTLTHSCPTPWAEDADLSTTNGLTDFGKRVVGEMNRLGMLIDISHVNDKTMNDVLDESVSPIIFSHSSARALCNHSRNVPDSVLERLPTNKGVIMVNFYNTYVTCRDDATTKDVANHFDYIKNITGVDYIAMGADYDGVTKVPTGLEDVSKYPNIIAELIDRGWSDEELKKISGQNIMRVMAANEAKAKDLQINNKADETWISNSEIPSSNQCRSDN